MMSSCHSMSLQAVGIRWSRYNAVVRVADWSIDEAERLVEVAQVTPGPAVLGYVTTSPGRQPNYSQWSRGNRGNRAYRTTPSSSKLRTAFGFASVKSQALSSMNSAFRVSHTHVYILLAAICPPPWRKLLALFINGVVSGSIVEMCFVSLLKWVSMRVLATRFMYRCIPLRGRINGVAYLNIYTRPRWVPLGHRLVIDVGKGDMIQSEAGQFLYLEYIWRVKQMRLPMKQV